MTEDPQRVATELLDGVRPLWERIVAHPFVVATADGSLDRADFDRWLVEDHAFVIGFRRFLTELAGIAPDRGARDVITGALEPLDAEVELFGREASARGLDLRAEPSLTTLGYTSYVLASILDGYEVALTVLYGAEKAYFDAWRTVRAGTSLDSPYRAFIENWSSDAFCEWVDQVASLLDAVEGAPTPPMRLAFERTVRLEIAFWDAVGAGAP